jgi:alkaline phosphatase D
MRRRSFLAGAGAVFLPSVAGAQAPLPAEPFALGIASGRPTESSVVLWSRLLAADPSQPLAAAIPVRWTIAEDERLQRVVQTGEAVAEARWTHSLHVDVSGLRPNRPYWYRFTVGRAASAIGRTRTAAAPTERLAAMRFVFASCQQYEQGWFSALRHIAAEDVEAVVHLGDYIYELSWGRDLVRRHGSGRTTTLDEYRTRHALYRSDPDLQAAHAAHPWLVTWDDHEVDDDYTDDISPQQPDRGAFLAQRAAAYQAYWEHMPLGNAQRPQGTAMRLHDRLRFGDMAVLRVAAHLQKTGICTSTSA